MTAMPKSPADLLVVRKPLTLSSVPEGAEGFVVADLARAWAARPNVPARDLLVICRDGSSMAALSRALHFFAPEIEVATVPAWDCLPYDRVSPHTGIVADRMATLSQLAAGARKEPLIVLTTVNAAVQRVPARDRVAKQSLIAAPGNAIPMDRIIAWLELNGFLRASTVREPGEYAVRGGILDLFAPGMDLPVRLDFFGDTLESIRSFDAETQRTRRPVARPQAGAGRRVPAHHGNDPAVPPAYRARFGAPQRDDLLYEAVSEGRRHSGMEHWLPLFHERLETLVRLSARHADRARAAGRGRRHRAADPDRRLLPGAPRGARHRRPALSAVAAGSRSTSAKPSGANDWSAAALARLTPFAVPETAGFRRRHRCPPGPQLRRRAGRAEPPTCSTPSPPMCRPCRAPASASPSRSGARVRASA